MKNFFIQYLLLAWIACTGTQLHAQTITPDLQNLKKWTVVNRSVKAVLEDGRNAVRFNEVESDGSLVLNGINFSNGIIELDIKGANKPRQSFVGIAFHGQDEKTYDAVYFRPFNFLNSDSARRAHAVQYISMPLYPWEKLREEFPGKYENTVSAVPNPDDWFHAKIVVKGRSVTVFVNNAVSPCLAIEKLTKTNSGTVALWVGYASAGAFANLTISPIE